jgi:hypothetical protein
MRKRFLIMLLIGSSFVCAQEKRSLNVFAGHQQLSVGSSSDFSSGTYFGISKNIGFLFLNSPLNFGFQFSERGGSSINLNDYLLDGNSSVENSKLDVLMRHSYFDVFINANISIDNVSFYLGPMVGINLSSSVSDLDEIVLPAIYDFDPSDLEAKQFDMGMNFGLTFHVNRFIGISLESYQGFPDKDEQDFTNYGLKLSIGL